MVALLLSAWMAASPEWTFVDEEKLANRSVLRYQTVVMNDQPAQPLDAKDVPASDSGYGSIQLGNVSENRAGIVWHPDSSELWFDANGDGRYEENERHVLDQLEVKVVGPFSRTKSVFFKRRDDKLFQAIRGYITGEVQLDGQKFKAALTDGNADGCFDQPGADQVWLDLDGNGRFDPLSERFLLGSPIATPTGPILLLPRSDRLGVTVRKRPEEMGRLNFIVNPKTEAAIHDLSACYQSEFGELIVIREADNPVEFPIGRYRLASLELKLIEDESRIWSYSFHPAHAKFDLLVSKDRTTTDEPLAKLTLNMGTIGSGPIRPGVTTWKDAILGNNRLTMHQCEVDRSGVALKMELRTADDRVLDVCSTGFG